MTKSAYDEVTDGQWWKFGVGRSNRKENIVCCDCGLTHEVEIKFRGGKIFMRSTRLPRETGGLRRALYRRKENDDA